MYCMKYPRLRGSSGPPFTRLPPLWFHNPGATPPRSSLGDRCPEPGYPILHANQLTAPYSARLETQLIDRPTKHNESSISLRVPHDPEALANALTGARIVCPIQSLKTNRNARECRLSYVFSTGGVDPPAFRAWRVPSEAVQDTGMALTRVL